MRKMAVTALESLRVDNATLRALPVEARKAAGTRQVKGACFSRVDLCPLNSPHVLAVSSDALRLLDVDVAADASDDELRGLAPYLSGSKPIPGSDAAAHCYCGHQFGSFAGQLGDGAAIYLCEAVNKKGVKWELQVKGAGPTPYSRSADGRKVLRSSIREFLCSEAMHHLKVPTTRAASLCSGKDRVLRDPLYDGNAAYEPCAVVSRLAPTFIRFGSFEICKPADKMTGAEGPSAGDPAPLKTLTEYVRKAYFDGASVVEMYKEVVRSTAFLVSRWQGVGWVHGVLNTDNMSILGLTIDYGPYGFMGYFDPGYICNGSDAGGRYVYSKQAAMCRWNLGKLIESLAIVHPEEEAALREALTGYDAASDAYYYNMMGQKLGLASPCADAATLPPAVSSEVKAVIDGLLQTMEKTYADFTDTFRALCNVDTAGVDSLVQTLGSMCASPAAVVELLQAKADIIQLQVPPGQLQQIMMIPQYAEGVNAPPRADENPQITLIRDEWTKLTSLQKLKKDGERYEPKPPCEKRAEDEEAWRVWLAAYTALPRVEGARKIMESVNPVFVLRQWVLQQVIAAAEEGDTGPLKEVLARVETPFTPVASTDEKYTNAPEWANSLVVTCSS